MPTVTAGLWDDSCTHVRHPNVEWMFGLRLPSNEGLQATSYYPGGLRMPIVSRGLSRFLSLLPLLAFGACTFVNNTTPSPDASVDAASPGMEASVEATVEATVEANVEAGREGGDAAPEASQPIPDPTNIDCSNPLNCYHLVCYDDLICFSTPAPGACPVGQVNDLTKPDGGADGGPACRPCTADDCDGLSSFCCGADVCKNAVACGMYVCAAIDATW